MSAGERLDQAHREVSRAGTYLIWSLTKRQITVSNLQRALGHLDEASDIIRSMLTDAKSGARVNLPTSGEQD